MQQVAASESLAQGRTFKDSVKAFVTYTPSGKVKPPVTILFLKQLASFVRVGVPVTTAIETFAEQATNVRRWHQQRQSSPAREMPSVT